MSEENQLLKFYQSELSNKLAKLLFPFTVSYGINIILYTRISKDGSFFQIGNQPAAAEEYFSTKLYFNNPTFIKPDNFEHNIPFFWNDIATERALEDQEVLNKKFGYNIFFFIPQIKNENLHLFCFSSTDHRLPLHTMACQHHYAFSSFASYFITEWSNYSNRMESFILPLGEMMGQRFHCQLPKKINAVVPKEKIKKFGAQLGLIDPYVQIEKLTKREKDCIGLLLEGKTANQIGEALWIDQRTVFSYLDNVKSKLGCLKKAELIETLQKYKNLGFL